MEAVVAITMVVTARTMDMTRVAITETDLSVVNDQTLEVEQGTTTITPLSSLATMIITIGTCPTRRTRREEDGKSTKETLLLEAKIRRKRALTRSRRRRSKSHLQRNLRFNPNTRRSRRCRVWKCLRSRTWGHRSTHSIALVKLKSWSKKRVIQHSNRQLGRSTPRFMVNRMRWSTNMEFMSLILRRRKWFVVSKDQES